MNRQSAGNQIIQTYLELKSIGQTATVLSLPYRKVHSALSKSTSYVSSRKKPVRTNTYNKDYFKIIDSSDKAYFLGLIKADGYINKERHLLAIRLQAKDVELLEAFCEAINLPKSRINKIKSRRLNQADGVEVAVLNTEFVSPLLSIKSTIPYIPEEFASDFIRGYFDGDGTIAYRNMKKLYFSVAIMGSPNDASMLEYIMKYVKGFTKIYTDKRSNLPYLKTDNQETIKLFRDAVYKDADIYLTRKKIKFDKFSFLFGTPTTRRKTSSKQDEDIV